MSFVFTSRRLQAFMLRLVGRHPTDYAQELQDFLEEEHNARVGGIPGGFNGSSPTTVHAGGTGSPGTELAGWAAADHDHPVETGAADPITLGAAASEGSGTPLARADHDHDTITLAAQVRALVSLRVG